MFKLIPVFLGLLLSLPVMAQDEYVDQIEKLRQDKNEELRKRKTSPLQKEDRKHFHDLNYYPVNAQYNVDAVFRENDRKDVIEIPTSAGVSKTFEAYGTFQFELGENNHALTAYKRVWPEGQEHLDHQPSLFVPFKDLTTGDETYGGGRYLDLPIPKDGERVKVDFNLCYNPYCAYGGGFSCPIPPEANFIKAEVKAGEKNYDSNKH